MFLFVTGKFSNRGFLSQMRSDYVCKEIIMFLVKIFCKTKLFAFQTVKLIYDERM